jgi:hypothetical protein
MLYKHYAKSKKKKYKKGGKVEYYQKGGVVGGPAKATTGMGKRSSDMRRRSTDSPFGTAPGPGEHTPNYPGDLFPKGYIPRWMGFVGGAQGGTQAPNMPGGVDYSSVYPWNPPDESLYAKGGKVKETITDKYVRSKKVKATKKSKKKKGYAKGGKVKGQQTIAFSRKTLNKANKELMRG